MELIDDLFIFMNILIIFLIFLVIGIIIVNYIFGIFVVFWLVVLYNWMYMFFKRGLMLDDLGVVLIKCKIIIVELFLSYCLILEIIFVIIDVFL